MKKCLVQLILLLGILSCSPHLKVINLDVKEDQLYIQDRKVDIEDFEYEVKRLTRGLSKKNLSDITFSLTLDGNSKIGIVTDLKTKIENWKDSVKKE